MNVDIWEISNVEKIAIMDTQDFNVATQIARNHRWQRWQKSTIIEVSVIRISIMVSLTIPKGCYNLSQNAKSKYKYWNRGSKEDSQMPHKKMTRKGTCREALSNVKKPQKWSH